MTLAESSADLALMSFDEARDITNDIKRTGSVMWSQITKAFQGRAWAALGYESWDDYCDAEFDGARLKLPREERTMVVASLADAGMSNVAIASAIGVSRPTVIKDRQAVNSLHPDPDDEIVDAEVIDEPTPEPRTVTGTDGKTYTLQPKPAPPAMSPEEQREADLVEGDRRLARYLELAISNWPTLVSLRTNPRRQQIVAHLSEPDRQRLAEMEARIR